ncbi:MAG: hypothetical protein ABW090_03725 [Sedimenticola sp.]
MFFYSRTTWALTAMNYPLDLAQDGVLNTLIRKYEAEGCTPNEAAVKVYLRTFNSLDKRKVFNFEGVVSATEVIYEWVNQGKVRSNYLNMFADGMKSNIEKKYR